MDNMFIRTLQNKDHSRPPVWYMRQAGRILPSYNELRKQYSFRELMTTPELAAKVTLLPVEDLGVDAAIIFSDILTIPTAMGMEIEWTDKGPIFHNPLINAQNPHKSLSPNSDKLSFVYKAIELVKKQSDTPLLGFCGAPLTTLFYMLQGTSLKHEFPEARKFIYQNKKETELLIDAVTEFSIEYANQQISRGVDAFQLFDTHAGLMPLDIYKDMFIPAVRRIADAVRSKGIPFIFFPKGLGAGINLVTPDLCDFVSIDWQTSLSQARQLVHPQVGLQGNIDPMLLFAPKEEIISCMEKNYKPFFADNPGWILNLGHGVMPNTPFQNIKYLTDWIKATNWI